MPTNISERDKALREVIDWCKAQRKRILEGIILGDKEELEQVIRSDSQLIEYSNDVFDGEEAFIYGIIMRVRLLDSIIDHCESMFGYSGSMPSEVPNQSEDAK